MLHAFKKVKKDFATGHSNDEEYERMVCPDCRKVTKEDCVMLAFQDGKIIEILSDQAEILNSQPTDTEYINALKHYVKDHLQELAVKVFCVDNPKSIGKERMKQYKRMLQRNFERVAGFKVLEADRYKNLNTLSKAKLISIFQVILLSKPKVGFTEGRDHVVKTRPDRANGVQLRETKSYYSAFLESPGNPTYRDSYSQQELCIWVDYQTLRNISSDSWAMNYLDINIAALEAILNGQNTLPPYQVQRKAEKVLQLAVKRLIRREDDNEELYNLYVSLQSSLGADSVISATRTFCQNAILYRFGAFLRLFSVEEVKKKIVEYIYAHQNGTRGTAPIIIDPYYAEINELPPLCVVVQWKQEHTSFSLTLKELSGF